MDNDEGNTRVSFNIPGSERRQIARSLDRVCGRRKKRFHRGRGPLCGQRTLAGRREMRPHPCYLALRRNRDRYRALDFRPLRPFTVIVATHGLSARAQGTQRNVHGNILPDDN